MSTPHNDWTNDGRTGDGMDRRRFMRLSSGALGALALSPLLPAMSAQGAAAASTTESDLLKLTAIGAVAGMTAGKFTTEAYASALIAQAQRLGSLNTMISFDPDQVIAAARDVDARRSRHEHVGPLAGLPLVVKDNIDTSTLPTSAGTPSLRYHQPAQNAPVVQALLDADALVFGKTNMHELAFGVTSNNPTFGAVHNPYNTDMIPGGSSGGTAAAVAARICAAGLGTDSGGSVRIPGSLCGVAGLRPSSGRYSNALIVPTSHTLDTAGFDARTVADIALLDTIITANSDKGGIGNLRGLRLGVPRNPFWQDLDPAVAAVAEAALARIRDLGVVLIEADFPQAANSVYRTFPIALFELNTDLPAYLLNDNTGVTFDELQSQIADPGVAYVVGLARSGMMTEEQYQAAMQDRAAMRAGYAQYLVDNNVSAMVFPTTPAPAHPIGEEPILHNGQQIESGFLYTRSTTAASLAGVPGLSMPAGLTSTGLPVGLEFDGSFGTDRRLLAIGVLLELTAALPPLAPPAIAAV
jgi:Asp-tRNA(Asn)/Glu-tRNA(Gln) amidotransferase A subunit family amidase